MKNKSNNNKHVKYNNSILILILFKEVSRFNNIIKVSKINEQKDNYFLLNN